MKNKLTELYLTLDKKQLRQLKKWIQSPLHNMHQDVQSLFLYLLSRREITTTIVQKEHIWGQLFRDLVYNDQRMRHILSMALSILQDFVRYYLYAKDVFYQEKKYTQYLFEQQLDKRGQKNWLKAQQILTHTPTDEWYYFHQYELEVLLFEVEGTQDRTGETNLMAILDNARLFFMITTLRYAYIALSHQNLRKVEYEIPLLDGILTEVKTKNYSAYPVLQIYYHAYYTLKDPEKSEHFKLLRNYLYQENLPPKEKRATLLICVNYAIKQVNVGKIDYARAALELYQYGLKSTCLLEEGELSAFAYKNIVTLGLNLKEYDWIEYFITNYSQYLPAHLQESYQHYNTAKLAFDKGDFEQAMTLLIQAEYNELILNIGAKVMLLKIYYQENHYNALEALLDSFRVFLNRKKVLAYHKTNYMNLILYTRKLLHFTADKSAIDKLKDEINATLRLAERKWLLEQLYN